MKKNKKQKEEVHPTLYWYTRQELGVALLSGRHPRAGTNSRLNMFDNNVLRLIFEKAVPEIDVSKKEPLPQGKNGYWFVVSSSGLSPEKFDKIRDKKWHQIDIKTGGRCGHTVLTGAIERRNMKLFQHVLKLEPDLLRMNTSGSEPLHMATKGKKLDFVVEIVRLGANVNAYAYGEDNLPLDIAIAMKNAEIADFLIKNGGCVSTREIKNTIRKKHGYPMLL